MIDVNEDDLFNLKASVDSDIDNDEGYDHTTSMKVMLMESC